MRIACPGEIKPQEYRVGLTPAAVRELVAHGHEVLVETGAGAGAGFPDADYAAAGAGIAATAQEVFERAEMIVKVKEPQPGERAMLREGQVLFAYLHLAPDPGQTRDLMASGVTAIAYETVEDARLFGANTHRWLRWFLVATLTLFLLAIVLAAPGNILTITISICGVWAMGWHLAWQLISLDPDDSATCLRLFRSNRDAGLIPAAFLALALFA